LKSAPQAQLKERNGKLYLSFQDVLSVHDAFEVLKPILGTEAN